MLFCAEREEVTLFLTHHHLIDTDFGYEIHFYRGLLCYIVRGYLTKASRLHVSNNLYV
jgi:hypothetical protein